jgi:hypothetical protein
MSITSNGRDRLIPYTGLEAAGFVNPSTGRAFTRKHLIDLMRLGRWPAAIQISSMRIAWSEQELREHYASRPRVSYYGESLTTAEVVDPKRKRARL